LRRAVAIRPAERPYAYLFFLYFFLITFPAYIVKPVKYSLLLQSFPPEDLPYAYLLSALLIGLVAALNARLLEKLPRRIYLAGSILFFMSNLLAFWFLLRFQWPGLSLAYWFWSDVFIATTVTQFWIAVNDVFHPHQAKRLIGFLVSGGLLGGIFGSLLAGWLARLVGTESLLLVCPVVLAGTFVVIEVLCRRKDRDAQTGGAHGRSPERKPILRVRVLEGFQLVRGNRYLGLLTGILVIAVAVGTLVDLQFNVILKGAVAGQDARTAFLAAFYGILLVVSYLFQLFVSGPLLRSFGIKTALLVAPALLAVGALTVFLVPAAGLLGWAVAVRGADKGMDNTISQSVRELLYIPVPAGVKFKVKFFIDMFATKFANGIGALLFLGAYSGLHWPVRRISLLSAALVAVWLVLVRRVQAEYVRVVKGDLERRWEDGRKIVDAHVDLDKTRLVFDTIQSREKSSSLYLMNLFDLVGKEKLTPELRKLIASQAEDFRIRTLDSVLDVGAEASGLEVGDILEDADWQRNVREILELDSYRKVMDDYLQRTLTAGTAVDEVARMEAAKLLGLRRTTPAALRSLKALLGDRSSEVLNYAIPSAARTGRKEFIPRILPHLANSNVRGVAAAALVAYGEKGLPALKAHLEDGRKSHALRRALPEVLAGIGSQRAADILLGGLERKSGGAVESEIIEALFRLKSEHPEIRFRETRVVEIVLDLIRRSCRTFLALYAESGGTACPDVGSDTRMAMALKSIFELLSLVYPTEDIVRAYQNLLAGTERSADYSLELLDNVLNKEIRGGLAPLVEPWSIEERIARCRRIVKGMAPGRRGFPSGPESAKMKKG
ncbi:MAG: MFS transporter, partial [Candidatus Aminicenantes bacterium]|nr:MFS transporter [Candidatus Aminicenantes bacterium]